MIDIIDKKGCNQDWQELRNERRIRVISNLVNEIVIPSLRSWTENENVILKLVPNVSCILTNIIVK